MSNLIKIHGLEVDDQGRCKHYHSSKDIVGIKFKCCQKYFACIFCHQELADHQPKKWQKSEFDQAVIHCGSCHSNLSIDNYVEATKCPNCAAEFNPKCENHFHHYFETTT